MIHCKIRQLRKDLGLNQVTMARHLCISQNAYSLIERGVTRLDIERLAQISGILQVTLDELLERSGMKQTVPVNRMVRIYS